MPKASVLQSAFNAGELSPLMYGQATLPKYKAGLDTAINYIPTLQGPLIRRPGTKFMNVVKDSSNPPVLIPFQFSITQAYMLEFGANYIRFYANNGQVITSGTTYRFDAGTELPSNPFYASRLVNTYNIDEFGSAPTTISSGSILEISSPYAQADLPTIKWVQNEDTLYLFHPKYPVFKLQRFGQQQWELHQVFLADGPYLPPNSYASIGDSINVTISVASPTVYPIAEISTGPSLTVTGAATDPASSGQIQLTFGSAHGLVTGQKMFVKGVGGTTEANNNDFANSHPAAAYAWTITANSTTTILLQGTTFVHAYTSGGTVQPALFQSDMGVSIASAPDHNRNFALVLGGVRIWGVLVGFIDAANANFYAGPLVQPIVSAPGLATAWYLGVYGLMNGYPSCGTFHQDRLVLAGCPGAPQEVDGSKTGDYETFSPSDPATLEVTDQNGFSENLNSRDSNVIRWLSSTAQALLAGSYTAEWAMSPSSGGEALTPTNFNAAQTSFFGSANIDAIQSGNATLYVQRAQRKVREMNFFFQVGTFRSTDLTELSEHITLPTITKLVAQKETQPLLWAIRSDGALVSMIYDRSDTSLQAGWTRHFLGGQSDSAGTIPLVTSMAVIPFRDLSFDQLWVVVKRYINSSFVYCIEYMTKIFDDSIAQEDAFQFDCGATFDNPLPMNNSSLANPAVITVLSHGFSNGDEIRFSDVVGLNKATTDINGNVSISNLLNGQTFFVANVTTNTFTLTDLNGNVISSLGYGSYISSGKVRKMITTVSGLTWLENETVSVLADGGIHPDVVVSNSGSITLQYAAAKVQIGYKYNSDGKILRSDSGAADGTAIGKTRRTHKVAFMIHNVGDLAIGTSFSNLIPVNFNQFNYNGLPITPFFSGIYRDGLESKYDFESQVCFRQNTGLPGTIQAITTFMEEQDDV